MRSTNVATIETRVCVGCGASLPSGVPDFFCPECALRGALAAGSKAGEGTLLGWIRRLAARKHEPKPTLAPAQNEWRQSGGMNTAPPTAGQVIGDYEVLE